MKHLRTINEEFDIPKQSSVFILHETKSGTPEANEIYGVYATRESAWNAGIEFMTSNIGWNLSREEAIEDLGKLEETYGNGDYMYIKEYKVQ